MALANKKQTRLLEKSDTNSKFFKSTSEITKMSASFAEGEHLSIPHYFEENKALIYQLDFNMKMKYFGPTKDQGVIKEINIDFNNDVGGSEILENMDLTITPANADEDDNYTVNVSIT